jgi:hypothetical protein
MGWYMENKLGKYQETISLYVYYLFWKENKFRWIWSGGVRGWNSQNPQTNAKEAFQQKPPPQQIRMSYRAII